MAGFGSILGGLGGGQQQPQPPQAGPESLMALLTALMQSGGGTGQQGPKGQAATNATTASGGDLMTRLQALLGPLAGPPKQKGQPPPDPTAMLMQILQHLGIMQGGQPGANGPGPQGQQTLQMLQQILAGKLPGQGQQ
jgi:hypothetical protein